MTKPTNWTQTWQSQSADGKWKNGKITSLLLFQVCWESRESEGEIWESTPSWHDNDLVGTRHPLSFRSTSHRIEGFLPLKWKESFQAWAVGFPSLPNSLTLVLVSILLRKLPFTYSPSKKADPQRGENSQWNASLHGGPGTTRSPDMPLWGRGEDQENSFLLLLCL